MEATLKISMISEEQLKHLQKARSELTKAGVIFDSGYDLRENIFDWELDWSLEGAELTDKKELVFNSIKKRTNNHIWNAENELAEAGVFFNSEIGSENRIVWKLDELQGTELKIRKPRKESTKDGKKVKPKLNLPFNIHKKGESG